jgi:hypothetical protein
MRQRLVPVGVAAALVFGLAACGSSDDGGGPAAPTTPSSGAAAATGPVAGADTPEGQAFCDEAARTLGDAFALAAQAYEDFFEAETGTDEWLLAFDATTQRTFDAREATVELAAAAPTPELKAVLDGIAAQIEINTDGSSERILDSVTAEELLGQLNTACGR